MAKTSQNARQQPINFLSTSSLYLAYIFTALKERSDQGIVHLIAPDYGREIVAMVAE